MQPPSEYKDIQKLTGCLATLSRFISKSGERNLPFIKNLRRASSTKFYWDDEFGKAFEELEEYLSSQDGARNEKESGTGILIRGPNNIRMEYALRFTFPATNNEVEYEAMVAALTIVKSLEIKRIWAKGDSNLIMD
ncbi:hypothetical protein LIER_04616 [Lithospermum erythrorhizon]|uniref:RNase H type-1 domain-containing protein n=1 Tax=Lithospermum erythrorhizon TaxID=34254 RepID=A0AAV3NXM8_LITER